MNSIPFEIESIVNPQNPYFYKNVFLNIISMILVHALMFHYVYEYLIM